MKTYLMLFTMLLVCSSCAVTRSATLVEFSTGQVLRGKFTDSMATGGTVQVTMPNGEILSGRYSAVRGTDQVSFTSATMAATASGGTGSAYATGSSVGTQRTVGGQGKAYALLTSATPGSTLVMEIIVIYGVLDGHGFGDARTNDGRAYKVQF